MAGAASDPAAEAAGGVGDGDVPGVGGVEVAAVAVVGDGVAPVATAGTGSAVVGLVMTLAVHDTVDPPTFPVPLHWVILTGIARLTLDRGSTLQCTAPPPPLPEPLHWVTIVPVARFGLQSTEPPPPLAEPTHWVTRGAPMGCAPGVLRPMRFVTVTLQLIACAASLSELLHCRMTVTRLADVVVNVPFGVEQGPSVHSRVTVVLDRVLIPLIVLTTATVHLIAVVAPWAAGPWPLHWSTAKVAAPAVAGGARPTREKAPVNIIRVSTMTCQVGRDGAGVSQLGVLGVGITFVLMQPALVEGFKPNWVPGRSGANHSR